MKLMDNTLLEPLREQDTLTAKHWIETDVEMSAHMKITDDGISCDLYVETPDEIDSVNGSWATWPELGLHKSEHIISIISKSKMLADYQKIELLKEFGLLE